MYGKQRRSWSTRKLACFNASSVKIFFVFYRSSTYPGSHNQSCGSDPDPTYHFGADPDFCLMRIRLRIRLRLFAWCGSGTVPSGNLINFSINFVEKLTYCDSYQIESAQYQDLLNWSETDLIGFGPGRVHAKRGFWYPRVCDYLRKKRSRWMVRWNS
jgi:hypothetical protein